MPCGVVITDVRLESPPLRFQKTRGERDRPRRNARRGIVTETPSGTRGVSDSAGWGYGAGNTGPSEDRDQQFNRSALAGEHDRSSLSNRYFADLYGAFPVKGVFSHG